MATEKGQNFRQMALDHYQKNRARLCGVRSFVSLTCMPQNVPEELSRTIETLYRSESGRILATLARLLGDLDVAEEAMHEAFAAALDTWPKTGIPDNPRPWLISTARFKAIDGMRRRARFDSAQKDLTLYLEARRSTRRLTRRGDRGRPPPSHLYLLSSISAAGSARCTHLA